MKKKLFISIIFIILVCISGCKTAQQNTTEGTPTTTTENTNQEQQQVEKQDEILKQKQYEGITYENIPASLDLKTMTEALTSFFAEYEKTVLSKDFDKWLTMISEKYKQKYNDPKSLEKLKLNIYGIYNIKDYFFNVVYQSRIQLNAGKPLEIFQVTFVDSTLTKAIVQVKFEDKILTYFFVYENGGWKIGVPEDFEQ
ncbi:MAG: hypothetical protein KBG82_05755 [Spirochaetes bacterium]|nr:hypothetical protein [Spirochaetota bacterium]NLJ05337.1 hypothetical protein [Exilispira sp.]HOV46593.1 hypothetical protein [Exilispira sp.]HPB48308.1 hypothetical protein [Exilispira sp.]HQQ19486.1 hypothetical protein [Exilispira sp.]